MGEKQIELVDHRSIGIDIDLGGTRRLFELAVLPKNRLRARTADDYGHAATVEQIFMAESLVKVTYDYGAEIFYDYTGNLQKVIVPLAAFCLDLDDEKLGELDERMLEAAGFILQIGSELTVEIDLRDGITQNDGTGWVQLLCCPNGVEKMDAGTGGFEIGPKMTMEPYVIRLIDTNNEPLARIYVRVEMRGDVLYIAIGDGETMIASRFLRLINPDRVGEINKPTGVLRFLASLRA